MPKKITLILIFIIIVVIVLFTLTSFIQAANNVWDNSDGDNDGNNPNNWSLGRVPTAGDTMYFDNTSDANCTFSGAISTDAINVTADYDGIIDFNDFAITTSGNQTYDGAGTVDCGASTITCGGNFDNNDQVGWTRGTSTLVMTGTDKTMTNGRYLRNLIISGTISTVDNGGSWGTLSVSGTFTIGTGWNCWGDVDVSGTLTGGIITLNNYVDVTSMTGTWSVANVIKNYSGSLVGGVTYGGDWVFADQATGQTITFGAGTTIFTGSLTFNISVGTYTINTVTNNSSLVIQGDVTFAETGAGDIVYSKGTGTITLSGGGAVTDTIDFLGKSVEDIIINDTDGGIKQLAGNVTTDSVTVTEGTLDISGYNITCLGNFLAQPDTTISGTGLVTVGGTFDLNGTSGHPITWNGPDLDVTGVATAHWTVATNSDASAGVDIDATDNCTNGGGNDGWNFGSPSATNYNIKLKGNIRFKGNLKFK